MTYAAIKVKIGLRPDGSADHPNFNYLPCVKKSGMDWSRYIDVHGHGWWYDTKCGHDDVEPGSPRGVQWGVVCAPVEFVDQAVAQFPGVCIEIGAAECQVFHDERSMHKQGPERRQAEVLQALDTERRLLEFAATPSVGAATVDAERIAAQQVALREKIMKALDPGDPTPGITRNKNFAEKMAGEQMRKP